MWWVREVRSRRRNHFTLSVFITEVARHTRRRLQHTFVVLHPADLQRAQRPPLRCPVSPTPFVGLGPVSVWRVYLAPEWVCIHWSRYFCVQVCLVLTFTSVVVVSIVGVSFVGFTRSPLADTPLRRCACFWYFTYFSLLVCVAPCTI